MGTRSETLFYDDDGKELCRLYRQMDGYPEGHGVELAKLCDVTMVNGYGADPKVANGMGCLAAQVIAGLKDGVGGIYVERIGEEIGSWTEYLYEVRGKEGEQPIIRCSTHTGEGAFPFNLQTKDGLVFEGTSKQWLRKYNKKGAA